MELKSESLKNKSKELIKMRVNLFLKYTKQFIVATTSIDYSSKAKTGSLAHYFLKNKNLAFDSVKNNILEQSLLSLMPKPEPRRPGAVPPENRPPRLTINRNKASVFATEGKVDHEGISTIFGQIYHACKSANKNYPNFR